MKTAKAPRPAGQGIRQSMSGLHSWTGLLLGWILYAMFLTGTVAYFKDELSQWMRPELAHQTEVPDPASVAQRIADELAGVAPGSPQWSMRLPDARNNSVYAFWRTAPRTPGQRGFGEGYFDPATGRTVSARDTMGGDFFYRFHFQFHYMPVLWGRWIAGAAAMFMLVAIVSGVITHKKIFVDFFTFRWGKGQRSWLDAHNALSVFGLPFHFMITYTGLVTLMALYMPWGEQAAFKSQAERRQLTAELSAFIQPGQPSGRSVPLAPVADMVRQAEERWGRDAVGRVTATNPGDAAARVAVARGDAGRVSMSPQYLEFEGTTGRLVAVHEGVGPAAETRGVLYALHLGRFSDSVTRWLYFLVSLAGTAMVGTGLVMWIVKRRQKLPDPDRPHLGFRLVERLNIASIAGLSVAMTAFLWGNRLLPPGMAERAAWEIHVFFIVWALALVHAVLRPVRKAWIEQLWAAAALLALLPLLNALTTERPLWHSLADGDWVFAGMDLMCWALAALHAALAIRTARHRPKVRSGVQKTRSGGASDREATDRERMAGALPRKGEA
ncbi:peptidase [Azospirillum thiophilum]|uniref:Peptidase n=1 Tax=Azospirillum thiophilum TaxID=528244 RepID=A0AAC8W070_9PROT|nr:PepSY-associated TM helix domain-containing protein [Azospirillum thiophilum]ALG72633.1 peptidase [Azospirillum thiophilum]KJR64450.1 peptidase [Azospirillum thiophilum]